MNDLTKYNEFLNGVLDHPAGLGFYNDNLYVLNQTKQNVYIYNMKEYSLGPKLLITKLDDQPEQMKIINCNNNNNN